MAMFRLSPSLTAVILVITPFVVWSTVQFRRAASDSYRRIRITLARINAYLAEHINGMTVVQLFNREARSATQFDRINAENNLMHQGEDKDADIKRHAETWKAAHLKEWNQWIEAAKAAK